MRLFFGNVQGDLMVEIHRAPTRHVTGVDIHKGGRMVNLTYSEWLDLVALARSQLATSTD